MYIHMICIVYSVCIFDYVSTYVRYTLTSNIAMMQARNANGFLQKQGHVLVFKLV